jgi:hypothetical protein
LFTSELFDSLKVPKFAPVLPFYVVFFWLLIIFIVSGGNQLLWILLRGNINDISRLAHLQSIFPGYELFILKFLRPLPLDNCKRFNGEYKKNRNALFLSLLSLLE